jgi:hypothetical protein
VSRRFVSLQMFTHRNPSGDRATATFDFSARCNSGTGISPSLVLSTRRMIVKPGAKPSTIGDCRVDRFRADLTGLLFWYFILSEARRKKVLTEASLCTRDSSKTVYRTLRRQRALRLLNSEDKSQASPYGRRSHGDGPASSRASSFVTHRWECD